MLQPLAFSKYQGTGNDFILVDGLAGMPVVDWPEAARFMCDRHYGVGADGLLLLERGREAPFAMTVYNADGSTSEMCGNGLRCIARYLLEQNLVADGPFEVETGAGVLRPEVLADRRVRVDMGEPVLERARIPLEGPGPDPVIDEPLGIGEGMLLMTAVSMGNPHAVIFVRDLDKIPVGDWGPRIEEHETFPQRTNVEFVEVTGRKQARMRVWERGSGVTLACGTGACATLVAGVLTNRMDREATIHLPGGPLEIVWDEHNHVWMTGSAEPVYSGVVQLPALRSPSPGGDHFHPAP